ncbi:Nicel/Cobalt-specific TonB-dependent outer membrane receptor [Myxococcus hansupus]|uniref:Nicel/Cobalt-specific TonB-dependent outer membrane receptor n=1 Tax=Pseudomyxococcus hansupus TaxID=1297742 RepID=A0A0H4X4Y7_9BACT|nr:Nicel/Cobalt-specific TonB-dependent outer membrane receptor [Myxococcus hansupus]
MLSATGELPVTPPVPLEAPGPVLPADVPPPEVPATVLLRITIDRTGEVSQVEVRQSAGTAFDRAAMSAALRWRFQPARRGDEAIDVRVDVPVTFVPPVHGHHLETVAQGEPGHSHGGTAGAAGETNARAGQDPGDGRQEHRHGTASSSGGDLESEERPPVPGAARPVEGSLPSATGHAAAVGAPSPDSQEQVGEGTPPASDAPVAPQPPSFSTTVRGASHAPPPVAVGDFHIPVGQLADVPRRSASDLMLLAPGVMLANHGGEGHAESIYIRGFDAGEGKDVELRLNGVPLNEVSHSHGHGYADTYFIIPELVESLRVTEGPYDPSQGDFGVAGTVEYQLGLARRGLTASLSTGSFAARRLSLLWGPPESSESTFVGVLLRQGHGFGPNRAYSNATVMAQTELRVTDASRLRLFGTSYGSRFSSPGVVRETDVVDSRMPCAPDADSQFFCSYDPNQGGAGQRHILSAELQSRLKNGGRFVQQGYVVLRQTRIRDNFTGFLLDTPPDGERQRGDNTEGYYRGSTVGLRGRYTPGLTLLGQPQPLELGYVARYDDVRTRSRRLRARGGVPYATVYDNQVRTTNLGAYASMRVAPLSWLTLRGGVRLDTFLFGVDDHNRPAVDRDGPRLTDESVEAYGFFASPRASAEVRLTPRLTWLTSAGLGARSSDAAALSDAELAPYARVTSGETGLSWRLDGPLALEARGAFFATRVSQDFVFDETVGRNQPIGASQRLGAFVSARGTWAERLDIQGSLAWAHATLPTPGASAWKLWDGAVMPYIPQLLGRVDASLRGAATVVGQRLDWNVALGHSAIGPRPLPLDRYSAPIFLFDVGARARWKAVEVGLSVENLLDTRWRESEFNFVSNFRGPDAPPSLMATRHFTAGAPRTFMGTLTLHLDLLEDSP